MTTEQNFLRLQLNDLNVSEDWKEVLISFLIVRRMIILYPLQKRQIENISKLNSDEVYKLAHDIQDPSVTLSVLEETAIDLSQTIEMV
jgi:hypothetical protein